MLNAFDYYDNDNSSNCQENSKSEIPVKYYPLYGDNSFDPDRIGKGYQDFFDSLTISKDKNIAKELLRQRIGWLTPESEKEISSYLEHNAQTRGDYINDEYNYKKSVINCCCSNVVWFQGAEDGSHYVKMVECRKPWCPTCGGKNGKIHKKRLHAILNRIDVEQINLRQIVFTVPEALRYAVSSNDGLNFLFQAAKRVISKHFGNPELDRFGHIKRYNLKDIGVIAYLHVFGETEGVFKPHINIHIKTKKDQLMKLSKAKIEAIRESWLHEMKKLDAKTEIVDIHYSFRNSARRNMHAIKYMSRPWSAADLDAASRGIQRLLVMDLTGFQYLRFWGVLSNCRYKDETDFNEEKRQHEKKVKQRLIPLFIAPFNKKSWENKLEFIEDGFYKIIKGNNHEQEKIKEFIKENQETGAFRCH